MSEVIVIIANTIEYLAVFFIFASIMKDKNSNYEG